MALSDADARIILNGAAALVTFLFGSIILAAGPRRTPNWFLSAFLFLIGANQASEALLLVSPFDAHRQLLFHLATVFAAFDPFFLYCFASVYPERNRLNRTRYVVLVLGGAVVLAFLGLLMRRELPTEPASDRTLLISFFLSIYTAVVYMAVLLAAMRPLLAGSTNPAFRWLYLALCIAVIPTWARVFSGLVHVIPVPVWPMWAIQLIRFVGPASLVAAMIAAIRRAPAPTPSVRRLMYAGALLGLALAILIFQVFSSLALIRITPAFLGRSSAALRWLLFSILVSMGVLRYEMLGMSLAARRRAARILVGVSFAALALAIVKTIEVFGADQPLRLTALDLLILGIAVATSQTFRVVLDVVAEKMYGVPRPGRLAERLETYRAAVAQAQRERRSPTADAELLRLRAELNLDPETVGVIERMATASGEGPLVTGEVVEGRYRILRFLGRGGGGRAFLARDAVLARDVVLKEILHSVEDPSSQDWSEARVAGNIGHPNVLTVHDVLARRGATLIVVEHVGGGTLEDRLSSPDPLTPEESHRIADGILAGLAAVHARGIVHQDVKPANILLLPDGTPKIADFGTSRIRRGDTLESGDAPAIEGTLEYMAPETKAGRVATAASDIYAVGRILERLLPAPRSAAIDGVIGRALAQRPEDRWPSALEMRRALTQALMPGTEGSSGPRPRRRPTPAGSAVPSRSGRN